MTSVKTAISMERPLFEELDALAEEMKVSRSSLISLATREYLERYKTQKLIEAINAAYDAASDSDDQELISRMRSKQREIVKDEW